MTTILERLRMLLRFPGKRSESVTKAPTREEIIPDDDVKVSVFKSSTDGKLVVRLGDSNSVHSVVVSGEALMHAASVIDGLLDGDSSQPHVTRTLN